MILFIISTVADILITIQLVSNSSLSSSKKLFDGNLSMIVFLTLVPGASVLSPLFGIMSVSY